MTLCLFFATGKTFTFRDTQIIQDNQTILRFTYDSMMDGKEKEATFYKDHIVGVAKTK